MNIRNNIIIDYILAWYDYECTFKWEAHPNYGYDGNFDHRGSHLEIDLRDKCRQMGLLFNRDEELFIVTISRETRSILAKKFIEDPSTSNEVLQKYIYNYNIIG